jgi:hypothetical protein
LNQARARVLALSGYEMALSKLAKDILDVNSEGSEIQFYSGNYGPKSDGFSLKIHDLASRVNINDGILAGKLEGSVRGLTYSANHLSLSDAASDSDRFSGLMNLRLRRLLNAYGDAHRFIDFTFEDGHDYDSGIFDANYGNAVPVLTSKISDGARSDFLETKPGDKKFNALGDRIIEARPAGGFKNVEEIKKIVNDWAQMSLNDAYLTQIYINGGPGAKDRTFYDLISQDLTVVSWEDQQFFRIKDEKEFGDFDASFSSGNGEFFPKDLQLEPPDMTNMWMPHSVPLINLSTAGYFVKAAVFYAPTNVSYLVESATTIPPYTGPHSYLDASFGEEAMMFSPSIGVAGPRFGNGWKRRENGTSTGSNRHLMSLRDALYLASYYEKIQKDGSQVLNFDKFRELLSKHGKGAFLGTPTFERVQEGVLPNGKRALQCIGSPWDDPLERGCFYGDYAISTLFHVLSCVRRLPGYMGAPNALMSPYLITAPDPSAYTDPSSPLCRQGFYKIEDFVWRFTIPKVCFLPTGYYEIYSEGRVRNASGKIMARRRLTVKVKFFESRYYRTQKEFNRLRDASTSPDIKIGPEFSSGFESEYLGFVGLEDFDQDVADVGSNPNSTSQDPFMAFNGGYKPQIIMNFDPEEGVWLDKGLDNSSGESVAPKIMDADLDLMDPDIGWAKPIDVDVAGAYDSLKGGKLTGSSASVFGDFKNPNNQSTLSPFGGIRLDNINHGEFANSGKGWFRNPLYWRLGTSNGGWLQAGDATGRKLSAGMMTFWFRQPSGYYFVHDVSDQNGGIYSPRTFTRVLVTLNLWENYGYDLIDSSKTITRPVTLTLGLKDLPKAVGGIPIKPRTNIFFRYDSNIGKYDNDSSLKVVREIFPINYFLGTAPYAGNVNSPVYDFLGLSINEGGNKMDDPSFLFAKTRFRDHRSFEVKVELEDDKTDVNNSKGLRIPGNQLGTWHRVSAGWRFWRNDRKDGSSGHTVTYSQQHLWLFLHDILFLKSSGYPSNSGAFELRASGGNFAYKGDSPHDGGKGAILPFDSSMILSLGEAHARRPWACQLNGYASQADYYYPYWRLNSCMDNFRLYLGPGDNGGTAPAIIPEQYFDTSNYRIGPVSPEKNWLGAMRYHVMNSSYIPEETSLRHPAGYNNEPRWILRPDLPEKSKLLAVGCRIYYPNGYYYPKGVGTTPVLINTPYVRLKASKGSLEITPRLIERNEQDFLFSPEEVGNNFNLSFQYKAHVPQLDGDLNTPDTANLLTEYVLKYRGIFPNYDTGGFFVNLPWIKEVNFRYMPEKGPQILKWFEN